MFDAKAAREIVDAKYVEEDEGGVKEILDNIKTRAHAGCWYAIVAGAVNRNQREILRRKGFSVDRLLGDEFRISW